MTPSMKPMPRAIHGALGPRRQQGISLLGIVITLALAGAVVATAQVAYVQTRRSGEVANAVRSVQDMNRRVLSAYAHAPNFATLTTARVMHEGWASPDLRRNQQLQSVWGGAVELAAVNVEGGVDNGFALTYENVDPKACVHFALNGGQGFYDVKVNGTSVMTGRQVSSVKAVNVCAASASNAVVQFIQAKGSPNGPTTPELTPCVPPPPGTRQVACPAGQLSSVPPYPNLGITQTNQGFCNQAYGVPGITPWQTQSNTCVPACVVPPPTLTGQSQNVGRSAACPAGQTGVNTWTQAQSRTETVTYACATLIGPLNANPATYSAWSDVGGKIGEVNTCSPTCATRLGTAPWQPNPQTQTQWVGTGAGCPAGQLGTHTWEVQQSQNRTAACANPSVAADPVWGAWSSWANTGATRNDVNTCAPQCVAPSPSVASQVLGCPAGQNGSITQQRTTTWSCPAPTGSAVASVGGWVTTGNSCAPAGPPPTIQAVFASWDGYGASYGQDSCHGEPVQSGFNDAINTAARHAAAALGNCSAALNGYNYQEVIPFCDGPGGEVGEAQGAVCNYSVVTQYLTYSWFYTDYILGQANPWTSYVQSYESFAPGYGLPNACDAAHNGQTYTGNIVNKYTRQTHTVKFECKYFYQ